MKRYMLDTNTVSFLIKGDPQVAQRVVEVPMETLFISAITEGELMFGLANRPEAKRLHLAVKEFLTRVQTLPWDRSVAQRYGLVRAQMQGQGRVLAPLDLLIAAHALHAGTVLVSNDQAFSQVPGLLLEAWNS